jgi:nicotinate-nucleotide pyrophosphorylase (carboxylating)
MAKTHHVFNKMNIEAFEEQTDKIIDLALVEDISHGDVTSETLIPPQLQGRALILAKEAGILAGSDVAKQVFLKVDPSLEVATLIKDGGRLKSGEILATVSGMVISILRAERVALNFLSRLSGIASLTAQYVAAAYGCEVSISDTRKTTPGLRTLEKYAVRLGGGHNHRYHLGDGILIKDTHLAALRTLKWSLRDIITQAKEKAPQGLRIEVEVDTIEEALEAANAKADIIMLDNMSPGEMRRVVDLIPRQVKVEASGGITMTNIRAAAMAGVDIISIGALTHSVKALDISLELETDTIKLP